MTSTGTSRFPVGWMVQAARGRLIRGNAGGTFPGVSNDTRTIAPGRSTALRGELTGTVLRRRLQRRGACCRDGRAGESLPVDARVIEVRTH
jgi:hypothetical protein